MTFWSQTIFPRICDMALGSDIVSEQRQKSLADVQGDILEIGFGSGLNLPHYPAVVSKIMAIDPNGGMRRRANHRIKASRIEVEFYQIGGERMPFTDHSFDYVVSTFTLCSVPDVNQILAEILRVLKPGGTFVFLEHGLSRDTSVQKWQQRFNRVEMWLAEGCRLNRNIKELVSGLPFSKVECDEFYLRRTPRILGYTYQGKATK